MYFNSHAIVFREHIGFDPLQDLHGFLWSKRELYLRNCIYITQTYVNMYQR